ncbi:MAG: UvrD-helicase domain-containing protein [Gammaproteobacteria bacterium]|nr:UvrD-helicase domain-containing protein [Gammaproteobacteria bacterium]
MGRHGGLPLQTANNNAADSITRDIHERQQALDTRHSFIVQAPAGSGKTELLTRRVLALLAIVRQPEEIVAITFTRKAAAEMRARILTALAYAEENEPEEIYKKETWTLAKAAYAHGKELNWHLLENPNRLRVTTIDALCLNLVAQMPVLSRMGIQPEIIENAESIYLAAIQQLFENADTLPLHYGASLNKILSYFHYDIDYLTDLLQKMLAYREQWLPYALYGQTDRFQQHLQKSLQGIIHAELEQLKPQVMQDVRFSELLHSLNYASQNLANTADDLIIDAWPDTQPESLLRWQCIANICLTKEGHWRKRLTKNEGFPPESQFKNPDEKKHARYYKEQFIAFLTESTNETLQEQLSEIARLPNIDHYEQQFELIAPLLDVLTLLATELRIQFQKIGKTDFTEIASAAKVALGSSDVPSELLLSLDNRIQHLLLDEFQDTSKSQFELLEKLISGWQNDDGRTLFLVGDPMQSIYRFRQAEVGLFIKAQQEGVGDLQLKSLQLSTNFRSDKHIVNWINNTFCTLFPQNNDIANGAILYSPSNTHRDYPSKTGIFYQPYANEGDYQRLLLEQLEAALSDPEQESISILVRSRKQARLIIPWLRAAHISYQAVDIEALELKPLIYDLLALSKALFYLGDKTAWFAILRAPWCGLTLSDLIVIANACEVKTLWETISNFDQLTELSIDGYKRLERVVPILTQAINDYFRLPLRQWIEHTWIALGGPACLPARSTLMDASSYFELLESFQSQTMPFEFNELEKQLQLAYSAPTEKARIQIMTMHKAKGLEFDTVILPELESPFRNDSKDILVWMDQPRGQQDENDILLAICEPSGADSDALYAYIRRQEKIKTSLENTRLLYVAATRAKKQLHLYFKVEDAEKIGIKNHSFLDLLWPVIEKNNFSSFIRPTLTPTAMEENNLHISTSNSLSRLPSYWQLPKGIQLNQFEKKSFDNESVEFAWHVNKERKIGIILHRLFKMIAKQGLNAWLTLPENKKRARIQGLSHAEGQYPLREADIQHMLQGLAHSIQSTHGDWLFKQLQQPSARIEWALERFQHGEVKQFILDATFIDENDTRWIVDYKMAQNSGIDHDIFLEEQKQLYTPQLERYAELLRSMESRKTKLVLYFPLMDAWLEWTPP